MIQRCLTCLRIIATDERKFSPEGKVIAVNGARISERLNEAPRVRCPCGQLVIFLKGSL